ncbi:20S rRNA accumulation protein 1 [Intoshia linei]|uniref:Pre-rRNA-processing protein TSR1 homolog n=1 Tax=Intoshia linei TaxID=1819745 RepID=A0A177B411_9BILA|nr:20S rRNA accumulation protein 1 [Intoshia linei]
MSRENNKSSHRVGPLRQSNKTHKTGKHRSKSQIKVGGKQTSSIKVNKFKKQSKNLKNIKTLKRIAKSYKLLENYNKNGFRNGKMINPHLVCVISLNAGDSFLCVQKMLNFKTLVQNERNFYMADFNSFKRKSGMFICTDSRNLMDTLDKTKISDTVLFVVDEIDRISQNNQCLLSIIFACGVKNIVWAFKNEKLSTREIRKSCLFKWITTNKIFSIHSNEQCQILLRSIFNKICSNKTHFENDRGFLFIEHYEILHDSIKVCGFVKGNTIDANSLMYIPNVGTFQINKIESIVNSEKTKSLFDKLENHVASIPSLIQQSLPNHEYSRIEIEDDQDESEMKKIKNFENRHKQLNIPKGSNEYQASWFEYENENSDGIESDDSQYSNQAFSPFSLYRACTTLLMVAGVAHKINKNIMCLQLVDLELVFIFKWFFLNVIITDNVKYNIKPTVDNVTKKCTQLHETGELSFSDIVSEYRNFPDQVQVPRNMPAYKRFIKYKAWNNKEKDSWKREEGVPSNFTELYHFTDISRARKRLFSSQTRGAQNGWYVIITLNLHKEIDRNDFISKMKKSIVIYSLLEYENKMSIVNFDLKMHESCSVDLKSKDEFLFLAGVKRFVCRPIFSENGDTSKHAFKYQKFAPIKKSFVATTYCPVMFSSGPMPIIVFKIVKGICELVAIGTQLSVDPHRICLKKATLTGHPYKINRKHAVIRRMFFNRDDIEWFKHVELTSRLGRKGMIREPIGTHGHMKCTFDEQLASNDVVYLNIYKRQFPKWDYTETVPLITCYRYGNSNDSHL